MILAAPLTPRLVRGLLGLFNWILPLPFYSRSLAPSEMYTYAEKAGKTLRRLEPNRKAEYRFIMVIRPVDSLARIQNFFTHRYKTTLMCKKEIKLINLFKE